MFVHLKTLTCLACVGHEKRTPYLYRQPPFPSHDVYPMHASLLRALYIVIWELTVFDNNVLRSLYITVRDLRLPAHALIIMKIAYINCCTPRFCLIPLLGEKPVYASSCALKFNGGQGNMLILLDVSSRVYPTYNSTMRDFCGGICIM